MKCLDKVDVLEALMLNLNDMFENVTLNLDDVLENVMMNMDESYSCLLYTSPSPRDATLSRMPSSA